MKLKRDLLKGLLLVRYDKKKKGVDLEGLDR